METAEHSSQANALPALAYHQAIARYFQQHENSLWSWFDSDQFTDKHVEYQKLELLKSTFRLSQESHESLYQLAEKARDGLGIDLPITLYQAQSAGEGLNAALMFLPDDIAIVLQGDITNKLSQDELLSVFAHEIGHHLLYTAEQGRYFTAMRLLHWCCAQPDCSVAFYETSRRYQLFTEVYADLGSLTVMGNGQTAIASLIKVNTGLSEVSVADYVAQADEVLAQLEAGSEGISHPETYLRAKILNTLDAKARTEALSSDEQSSIIAELIIGKMDVTCVDLLDQQQLSKTTRLLIDNILQQPCMRTDTLEAMAQQYFPDYSWLPTPADNETLAAMMNNSKNNTLDYFAYVLLDFATADHDIQPVSISIALQLATELTLEKPFSALLRKELKYKKADIEKSQANTQETIQAANSEATQ